MNLNNSENVSNIPIAMPSMGDPPPGISIIDILILLIKILMAFPVYTIILIILILMFFIYLRSMLKERHEKK